MVKKTRKFDGENFNLVATRKYKMAAQMQAHNWHDKGYNFRIIDTGRPNKRYAIYVRKK